MAQYIFETISAADAANFTSEDQLFFQSAMVSQLGVVDTLGVGGGRRCHHPQLCGTLGYLLRCGAE